MRTKIVATVSRLLAERFKEVYTRNAIIRMVKVAREYPDEEIAATLSHQLTWSHFVIRILFDEVRRVQVASVYSGRYSRLRAFLTVASRRNGRYSHLGLTGSYLTGRR